MQLNSQFSKLKFLHPTPPGPFPLQLWPLCRRSAARHQRLKPYCLFGGDVSSPIAQWLRRMNVTLVLHDPEWREQLLSLARSRMKVCREKGCDRGWG